MKSSSLTSQVGRVAQLPAPSTPLPRAKPLPVPRPPTKWETFAAQKGIVKKKRSKLTFDEGEQTWKRRYGYQKVGDESAVPIIEASAADEVSTRCCLPHDTQPQVDALRKQAMTACCIAMPRAAC